MTNSQKILITKLFTGHYLVSYKYQGKKRYRLMASKHNSVASVRARTVDKLDQYIDSKLKLWKKDELGRISLNLNVVRQLHGRSILKSYYKNRHSLEQGLNIYKGNNRKKLIKKTTNETNYSLFG